MKSPSSRSSLDSLSGNRSAGRAGASASPVRSAGGAPWPGRIVGRVAAARMAGLALAGTAGAASFQVDFVSSTYQAQSADDFSDLLARHQEGSPIQSTVTTGLEDISTTVYASGVTTDYSILLRTQIDVGVGGTYSFQVGTDWGRGGGAALIDDSSGAILDERVITDDVWWNNDWTHSDVFTTSFDFQPGDSYTLMWVGFEGCCGGTSTVRFSVDGSAYQPLDDANLAPFTAIPEPGTAALLGTGLVLLGLAAPRIAPAAS